MKKPLIAFLYLLITQTTFAQRNGVNDLDRENFFRIGFKGTVNANKLPGATYKQGINYNYEIGGFLQFNFSKRFGIQPEVNFLQNSYTYGNDATYITDDLFRDGTQKMMPFNYMQIPILMNMNLGLTRHVKLQLGPAYGFSLVRSPNIKNEDISLYKDGELSAIGGLWIQLPFINLGGRYEFDLSNVYNPDLQRSYKNQAIQVFVGFTF
jgi:hypothetical protein